jgi:hypothetical protein
MAQLLVAVGVYKGLAAHIPDAAGKPLCHAHVKLTLWQVQDRLAEGLVVCRNCRLQAAKKAPSRELSIGVEA